MYDQRLYETHYATANDVEQFSNNVQLDNVTFGQVNLSNARIDSNFT